MNGTQALENQEEWKLYYEKFELVTSFLYKNR